MIDLCNEVLGVRSLRGHGFDFLLGDIGKGGRCVRLPGDAYHHAPLDLLFVRKIGLPSQPELAMGAVADGEEPTAIRNSDVIELSGVNEEEFDAVCNEKRAEIERRRKRNLGDRARSEVRGRVTIIIDDGIATGATTLPPSGLFACGSQRDLSLRSPWRRSIPLSGAS